MGGALLPLLIHPAIAVLASWSPPWPMLLSSKWPAPLIPFLHAPGLAISSKLRAVAGHLFQVMNNTEQLPLDIYLGSAPQGKTVKPHHPADMGKGRFGNRNPQTVERPANRGVDLALHPVGKALSTLNAPAMEIRHLPDFGFLRMAQTGRPERTAQARWLGRFEFGGRGAAHLYVPAAAIQPLACRADTMAQILGKDKIRRGKQAFGPACTFLPLALLIPVCTNKTRVPLTEQPIRR